METDEDRLLAPGLPGRWYAIVGSHRVGREPLRALRLDRPLVIARDGNGAITVHDDIRTYEAVEYGGIVFAYVPTAAGEPAPPFEGPPELVDPAWSMIPIEMEWRVNYRYVMENALDPMHGPYLHGDSHSMSVGSKDDVLEAIETPRGFRVRRKLQADTAFDWVEFVDTGLMWVFLDIPYAPQVGPGGPFRIVGLSTPIDAERTYQFFYRLRRVSGWERDLWHFLHKERLVARHWAVLEQDRAVLEQLPPDARNREMLYQHDIGVTRFRRHLREAARRHAR